MKKALLVVDMQNDFCPGGSLAVKDGDAVITLINKYTGEFSKAGNPVVFTRDWHTPDHSSFADNGGIWPPHCVAGTKGAKFHSRLKIPEDAVIISKADKKEKDAYSGFEGTALDKELKSKGVGEIWVCGLAADYCVKSTAIDGVKNGYRVKVIKDAVKAVNVNPDDGKKAFEEMKNTGAVIV